MVVSLCMFDYICTIVGPFRFEGENAIQVLTLKPSQPKKKVKQGDDGDVSIQDDNMKTRTLIFSPSLIMMPWMKSSRERVHGKGMGLSMESRSNIAKVSWQKLSLKDLETKIMLILKQRALQQRLVCHKVSLTIHHLCHH